MEEIIINISSITEKENSISRMIATTVKKRTGKGPESIKTVIDDGFIEITIKGLMTKMEENFVEQVQDGGHEIVENVRLKMINSFLDHYTNSISEIMGNEVKIVDVQWCARNNTCKCKAKIL